MKFEQYIEAVRDIALDFASLDDATRDRLRSVRMVYGVGTGRERGRTIYGAWNAGPSAPIADTDVIEVAASGQESWLQLAGTTVHELAHALAGWDAGHGKDWKSAGQTLGFRTPPRASGQTYHLAAFPPAMRERIYATAQALSDGDPQFMRLGVTGGRSRNVAGTCSAGTGTRGGTSRGVGSGSRLRLWECACPKPIKVRVASDDFKAHCDLCGGAFERR